MRRTVMKRIIVAAGLSCILAASASGSGGTGEQDPQTPAKPATAKPAGTAKPPSASEPAGSLTAADRTFVMEAARGGMAEVEMGRLAVNKASNADVKQFGQRMVDDHGKANDELKGLASRKNVTLPTE